MCKNAEAQFNTIIDEYGRFLSQTIIRLCPKDLGIEFNDIEQEARLRLWHALRHESEIRNPASYLYRIALTATIDAVRKIKAKREEQLHLAEAEEEYEGAPLALSSDPRHSPELEAERRQLASKVRKALARLPDNRRRAVGLYLEGFGSQEIADLLGWSEAKARNLLYRGLHDLRAQLCMEGVEYEIDK
ncbi:MAG TPA: RNA polymerase sigma factor [Blastocatellia bacterium]|nr:RNA polymerase sigma factor [Blastocatellia bacterium]